MGVNVNDILTTICQYLDNEFTGFHKSLREISDFPQKVEFIEKCKHLIKSGWNADFESRLDLTNEQDDFFSEILQGFLNNPHQRLFKNRSMTEQSVPIITYFTRLRLFILVCETLQKDEKLKTCNDNVDWMEATKLVIHAEFNRLAKKTQIECRGMTLKNLEDLRATTAALTKQHFSYTKPLLLATAGVSIAGRRVLNYFFNDNPSLLLTCSYALSFCVILVALYVLYKQFNLGSAIRNLSLFSKRTEQLEANSVLTDDSIKKFFFTANPELQVQATL